MDHVRDGFATLGVSEQVQRAALDNLQTWLSDPRTSAYVPLIHALIDAEDWYLLLDCFYQLIPFGTGGRRGPVGIGPNRINPFTLTSSIQGHCEYLRERYDTPELSVVVAYDVRVYRDARGHYPYDVSNPLTT
jgi:phosphoglucomutase/phosphomannomutase